MQGSKISKSLQSGVAQRIACWAHNPKVCGSRPRSAIVFLYGENLQTSYRIEGAEEYFFLKHKGRVFNRLASQLAWCAKRINPRVRLNMRKSKIVWRFADSVDSQGSSPMSLVPANSVQCRLDIRKSPIVWSFADSVDAQGSMLMASAMTWQCTLCRKLRKLNEGLKVCRRDVEYLNWCNEFN